MKDISGGEEVDGKVRHLVSRTIQFGLIHW
jgi:hypothetical protein